MSSSADTAITNCANCGKAESDAINLKRCTACKMVKYCSRDCQVAHRPKHKTPARGVLLNYLTKNCSKTPQRPQTVPFACSLFHLTILVQSFMLAAGRLYAWAAYMPKTKRVSEMAKDLKIVGHVHFAGHLNQNQIRNSLI